MKERIIKFFIIIVSPFVTPVLTFLSMQALWEHPVIMTLGAGISIIEYRYGSGPTDPRPFAVSIYFIILVVSHLI